MIVWSNDYYSGEFSVFLNAVKTILLYFDDLTVSREVFIFYRLLAFGDPSHAPSLFGKET